MLDAIGAVLDLENQVTIAVDARIITPLFEPRLNRVLRHVFDPGRRDLAAGKNGHEITEDSAHALRRFLGSARPALNH